MPAPLFLLGEKPGVARLLRPVSRQQRVLESLKRSANQLQPVLPRRLEVLGFRRGNHQIALRHFHLYKPRIEVQCSRQSLSLLSSNRTLYVSSSRLWTRRKERKRDTRMFRFCCFSLSFPLSPFSLFDITDSVVTDYSKFINESKDLARIDGKLRHSRTLSYPTGNC